MHCSIIVAPPFIKSVGLIRTRKDCRRRIRPHWPHPLLWPVSPLGSYPVIVSLIRDGYRPCKNTGVINHKGDDGVYYNPLAEPVNSATLFAQLFISYLSGVNKLSHTSINPNILATDPFGFITRKKDDDFGDIRRFAEALKG